MKRLCKWYQWKYDGLIFSQCCRMFHNFNWNTLFKNAETNGLIEPLYCVKEQNVN